ncbi:hemocyte protein-glutamine gamma-glutamyltransferase-like [Daphnia pulicaria]|uniref:hemocyte protein-glutamine gamma-glutamyltransferase-like n=1 Tax=Daphnia pulicaria TaxID=35523 RepID=UPI001EEAD0D1|nr:hemocyte protein-glutamine gamma-glutamyltransferase-like [Daphnia pulicaria]XP_046646772.1 hemocyte protein-glutamine gamma-glutamyltransferase-like [Daphnia pulicaria]
MSSSSLNQPGSPGMLRRSNMTQQGSPVMLHRSMSNSGLNNLAHSSSFVRRNNDRDGMGNNAGVSPGGSNAAYRASLVSHYAEDLDRRRRAERAVEEIRTDGMPSDNLKIESVELFSRDNAREHRTDRYEMVFDNGRDIGSPSSMAMSRSVTNMASMSSMSPMSSPMLSMDYRSSSSPSTTVLRRGQPFFMAIRMKDRNFDPRRDILRASFTFGPNPQVTKGTKVVLPFRMNQREFSRAPQKWDMRLHQQEGFNITFQVHIPANALVGLWRVNIETTTTTPGARVDEFRFKDDIYILFNPFCRDDPVYLDNEELRREYLMNETGKVFVGTHHRPKGRRWVYGQFSDVALPAAQLLLEQSGLNPTERGNPVQVVRAIASIINANEGFGLLEGKWEGSFEDGVCPWVWTGSNKIFEHYLRNGSKPVKYGQCWVFAAVATSIFRALGIPSRPVTNFVSARDTNHTLSVDKYFDIFGDEMKGGPDGDNQDAVWNFHAWTEVWMSRPDLQANCNGWQAIDPTPPPHFWQKNTGDQKSRGPLAVEAFRRGPSSVESVRRGEVGFAFDTPYLFAEVNAEVSHFQEDETSHWGYRKIHVNNYQVGRMILTKRPGADDDVSDADAEDITSLYKNPDGMSRYQKQGDFNYHFNQGMSSPYLERRDMNMRDRDNNRDMMHYPGTSVRRLSSVDIARKPWYDESRHPTDSGSSAAERVSAMNASRSVERTQPMFDNRPVNEDVYFDLIEQEKVAWGQPFNLQVLVQNRSQEMRTITTILSANSVYYTGVTARRLGRSDRQFVLQPGGRETLQVRISWDEYRDKIVDYGHIKIFAMASVQETKQSWSEEDDFQLEKPKLDVQIRGNPQVGQDCFATFSFMNPVSVTLTECEFTFEGPGLVRPQTVKYRDVKPGEMISFAQKFIPRFNGERKLVATFNSRELGDIVGSRPIHVRD